MNLRGAGFQTGEAIRQMRAKIRSGDKAAMLAAGTSYSAVQDATGCSRATVAKIAKRVKVAA